MGNSLTEDTIPMILRRTERKVKQRAEDYKPRVTGVERTRKVWFFEVGDYVVRLRAIPKSAKQQRVETMDVRVKCSCPSWRWNGPEHWAMEHSYQYGRPKGTASFPKVNDPKFRHAVCKHTVACFRYIQEHKLKIEAPKKLSEMLEQLSVTLGIEDNPRLKKRVRKRKYARLDPAFKDPHPGIQYKLQPPRGNSQHGPEQTIEGDETMTTMQQIIEQAEARDQLGEGTTQQQYGDATGRLDSGAETGDTENNWIVVDVDSGGTVGQGFGSRGAAEGWSTKRNLGLIPEAESHRMEKADPLMLALKRDHPNIVWVMPPGR